MTKMGAVIFSGMMLCIGCLLLLYTFTVPHTAASLISNYGNMFYPRIILTVWCICATMLLIQSMLFGVTLIKVNWRLVSISVCLVVMCGILLGTIGFLPACVIFCVAYPFFLGYKNLRILLPVSCIYAVALWFIFNKVLFIILPATPF